MTWKTYNTRNITERYLFKFLPLNRVEEFLKNGAIWFSRADKFGDKMECVQIDDLTDTPFNYEKIERRMRTILISCWHLANKESIAFWDTYSESKENRKNIAIRFNRDKLMKYMNDYFIKNSFRFCYKTQFIHGKVVYKNLINVKSDTLNRSKIAHSSFRKEAAFKYENEYRLIVKRVNEELGDGVGFYIGEPNKLNFD